MTDKRTIRSISAADFARISDEFAKHLHPKDAMIFEIHALRAERDALRDQWSDLLIEQARLMAMRDEAVQQRDDAIIELSLANAQRGVLAKENMALGAELDALRKVDTATVIRFLVGYTQYEDNYSTDFSHSAAVRAGLNAALAVQP